MDEAGTPHEVVVGVDGSPGARSALAWGLREARLRGSAVRLVTVWPENRPPHLHDGGMGRPGLADFERDVRSSMGTEAAAVAASTACEAVPVHPEVRYGLLLGSVGLHAVTGAPCPVAVVRPVPAGG